MSAPPLPGRGRERGGAAVELAVVLPLLILFLAFPMFYARCFWHYTVAQKAAQDAARYLAAVPAAEMRSRVLGRAAAATAVDIATRTIAELAPGMAIAPPRAFCDNDNCGQRPGEVPTMVHVVVNFGIVDTWFGLVDTGRYGLPINADVTVRYVGQ